MSKPYTVIGVHPDNGQIVCHHVKANDGTHAFAVVAANVDGDIEMVVALEGHQTEGKELTFAGESLVDSQTVQEQQDVFGDPAVTTPEDEQPPVEIVVRLDSSYVPEDGDAFDAVQSALDHFEIPATLVQRDAGAKARIVIGLEGGIIQGVTGNVPIDYLVYDYDIEGCGDDEVVTRPALDDGDVEVYAAGIYEVVVNAAKIVEIFEALASENHEQ